MKRVIVGACTALGALMACSDTTTVPSGLFVVISAPDLYAGSDFDSLEIRAGNQVVKKTVSALPTSISVVGTPGAETKVEVRALLHGVVRSATYAKTTMPSGRFAVLPLSFSARCRDRCVQVAEDDPIASYCDPTTLGCVHETVTDLEVQKLATYDPAHDPTVGLASIDCGGGTIIDPQVCNGADTGNLTCKDVGGEGSTGDLSCVGCRGVTSSTCSSANGLAQGAVWPTLGGTPLRQNRSSVAGPRSAAVEAAPLNASPLGGQLWAPVIGKDDTVWFTSGGLTQAPKRDPLKRAGVVLAVQNMKVTEVFQPDAAADCHLDLSVQDGGSTACRLSAPVIADDGSVYTTSNTTATFQIVNTKQQFETLVTGAGCAKIAYCNTMNATPVFRNDASAGRLFYLPTGGGLFTLKVSSNNILTTPFQAPFGFSADCTTWGTNQLAVDSKGNLYTAPQTVFPKDPVKFGVCAVDAHGLTKWHSPVTDAVATTPVIGDDGTVYFGGGDQFLHALDPKAPQKFVWSAPTGGATTSPAIGVDGTLYVGSSDENLYAFDADGSPKWSLHVKGAIAAQPLVDGDGTIYFGTQKGLVYAANPNGTVLWQSIAGSPISHSGAIDSRGTLFMGTDEGFVFAFPRTP